MTAEMDTAIVPLPRVKARGCRCDQVKRVPLFEVEPGDGDEGTEPRVFTIPEHFEAHVTLDYLEVLESRGSDAAYRWAARLALGPDGWAAMRSPGMDDETLQLVWAAIISKILGANKRGPKGQG